MSKPLSLTLAVALTLTGCSVFEKSQTWQKVVDHRSDRIAAGGADYSEELHKVLAAENIDHKVVTYEYRYRTRLREEAVDTRSAVIYRDSSTPKYPWWIMDENLGTPVWLPNGEVDRQVRFFLRAPVQVLAQREYPGEGSGKSTLDTSLARNHRPASLDRASAPVAIARTRPQTAPTRVLFRTSPVKERTATTRIARANPHNAAPLSARIRPPVFASKTAPRQTTSPLMADLDRSFRKLHGTTFDLASSTDRRKMSELRETFLVRKARISMRTL